MASRKRVQFSTIIAASVSRVFESMIEPRTYEQWASAFMEGSCFEGSWQQGERIRFLGPDGDGMVAEIAENRRHEFISIRHLGLTVDQDVAVEFESYMAEAWPKALAKLKALCEERPAK